MDNIDLMEYWLKSFDKDFNAMKILYNNKQNSLCLCIEHLVIEKLLNGLHAKNNKVA